MSYKSNLFGYNRELHNNRTSQSSASPKYENPSRSRYERIETGPKIKQSWYKLKSSLLHVNNVGLY